MAIDTTAKKSDWVKKGECKERERLQVNLRGHGLSMMRPLMTIDTDPLSRKICDEDGKLPKQGIVSKAAPRKANLSGIRTYVKKSTTNVGTQTEEKAGSFKPPKRYSLLRQANRTLTVTPTALMSYPSPQ